MYARNGYDAMHMRSRGWVGKVICGSSSGLGMALRALTAVNPPAVRTEIFPINARRDSESIFCIYSAWRLSA